MITRRDLPSGMIFNVLIKQVNEEYIAHCLELDIVTTAGALKQAQKDIVDLIAIQISYAFSNDNLDFLYRPAPQEVWQEFYKCKEKAKKKIKVKKPTFDKASTGFIPPWFIARTCMASSQACHV